MAITLQKGIMTEQISEEAATAVEPVQAERSVPSFSDITNFVKTGEAPTPQVQTQVISEQAVEPKPIESEPITTPPPTQVTTPIAEAKKDILSQDYEQWLQEKTSGKVKSISDLNNLYESFNSVTEKARNYENSYIEPVSDLVKNLNSYVKDGGDPYQFLHTQLTDFDKMPDAEVMRFQLSNQYKDLPIESLEALIVKKYNIDDTDSYGFSEIDKQAGKAMLTIDARNARKELNEWKAKNAVAPLQQQRQDQERLQQEFKEWQNRHFAEIDKYSGFEVSLDDATKKSKVNVAVTDDDKRFMKGASENIGTFYSLFETDGQFDFNRFNRVLHFAKNPDSVLKAVAVSNYDAGYKAHIIEAKNPSIVQGEPVQQSEVSPPKVDLFRDAYRHFSS